MLEPRPQEKLLIVNSEDGSESTLAVAESEAFSNSGGGIDRALNYLNEVTQARPLDELVQAKKDEMEAGADLAARQAALAAATAAAADADAEEGEDDLEADTGGVFGVPGAASSQRSVEPDSGAGTGGEEDESGLLPSETPAFLPMPTPHLGASLDPMHLTDA